ncbi:gamma-gliadin-like isoform X2 [Chrysoperla carnea]|uniref:gamma-gliadin-like isoform X2 n=1 Tax=Chrysoperla carnea TaxID=189513 RepID=UPI001D08BFA7|nr:gamma-gliadin-like isoform X2 [Chrysoperla carnea]
MSSIKMYNNLVLITCCVLGTILAYPVSQPLYQSQPQPQQVQQFQQIPAEYLQQYLLQAQQRALQPQATPVKDPEQNEPQLDQGIARQPPQQVLPNNVDRQVRYQQQAQPQYRVVQFAPQQLQQQQRYVAPSITSAQIVQPKLAQAPRLAPQLLRPQQSLDAAKPAEPEDYEPNPSYQFGFDVKDDLYTNYQNRKEQRDGDKITGSYSVVDSDGFIRTVTYTADPKEGFKAEVNRQPTDIVVKIPQPQPQYQTEGLLRQQQTQQYLEGSQPIGKVPASQKQRIVYQYQ